MAFAPLFTAESVAGEPQNILFTDTSSGSDSNIVSRRIYFRDYLGSFVVESGSDLEYSEWPLPLATPITLDLLDADAAASITVEWLDVSNVVLYDYTIDATGFTEYSENFDYSTTQLISSNNKLTDDNNFWYNKTKLRTLIDAGNNAILRDSDLYSAQLCYDEATKLRLKSQYFFNGNS